MTGLILAVTYADGTTRVERSEPDTARGKRMIEKAAFEAMARVDVESATVRRQSKADVHPDFGGNGRYR